MSNDSFVNFLQLCQSVNSCQTQEICQFQPHFVLFRTFDREENVPNMQLESEIHLNLNDETRDGNKQIPFVTCCQNMIYPQPRWKKHGLFQSRISVLHFVLKVQGEPISSANSSTRVNFRTQICTRVTFQAIYTQILVQKYFSSNQVHVFANLSSQIKYADWFN